MGQVVALKNGFETGRPDYSSQTYTIDKKRRTISKRINGSYVSIPLGEEERLKDLADIKAEMQAQISEAERSIADARTQIDEANALLESLSGRAEELEELNTRVQKVIENNDTLSSRMDALEESVAQSDWETNESLQNNISQIRQEVQAAIAGINETRTSISFQVNELQRSIRQNAEAIERQQKAYEDITLLYDSIVREIRIGTVSESEEASVTSKREAGGRVSLSFGIPRGRQGEKGEQGERGERGPQGIQGIPGEQGISGISAYDMAVARGFVGTELDYLESLRGPKGERGERGLQGDIGPQGPRGEKGEQGIRGLNLYELAKLAGFTGTMEEFIEYERGLPGKPGKSLYELARDTGFTGTLEEFIETQKIGPKGEDGLSAYQIAVKNGYWGTEAEWLKSLSKNVTDTIVISYAKPTKTKVIWFEETGSAFGGDDLLIATDEEVTEMMDTFLPAPGQEPVGDPTPSGEPIEDILSDIGNEDIDDPLIATDEEVEEMMNSIFGKRS